ncbi:hypothetical protein BaRGS_00040015 [Batillaria attramentaria]|uniref:Uncharacterized protein n=1 Tax=Batillaria attramentaria TaxID=370345 RepID=A0ABD0J1L6_9CAEN
MMMTATPVATRTTTTTLAATATGVSWLPLADEENRKVQVRRHHDLTLSPASEAAVFEELLILSYVDTSCVVNDAAEDAGKVVSSAVSKLLREDVPVQVEAAGDVLGEEELKDAGLPGEDVVGLPEYADDGVFIEGFEVSVGGHKF